MQTAPYGFRILGPCTESRRLVDAAAAFAGYAGCDERAEVHREAYLSAFQFGENFRGHIEMTGSTKGYNGPCWSPWLWFDIDREDDLDGATSDARRLCATLVERYRIDGDELLVFFSGSKGFHVGLSTALWSARPSEVFHKVAGRFAERIAETTGVEVDSGIYDRVRAFRAPNSQHPKTGLYKRRLSLDELLYLRTSAIVKLAAEPVPFDVPDVGTEGDEAAADWRAAADEVQRNAAAYRQRRLSRNGMATLNRQTLEFIHDGAAVGNRHRLLFSAAANLAEFGCPPALAHALLTEPGLDAGLAPKDVRRQIECGLSAVNPESKPQEAAESPSAGNPISIDPQVKRRDTSDSGVSEGQFCQQVTGATK